MGEREGDQGLRGQSLARLCAKSRDREERLAPELVAWIGARAADALQRLHSAAVHGDASSENVFLTYDGCVVLIGEGGASGDPRDDLLALAAALYEAAVGRGPSAGTVHPPSSLLPGFPEELSGILQRALDRDPEMRPATAAELGRELDHFAGRNASESSLSELLSSWFEDERTAEDAASEPRAPVLAESAPPGLDSASAGPLAHSVRPPSHEGPSRWGLLVLACALFMVMASLLAVRRSGPLPGRDGEAAGVAAGSGALRAPDPPVTAGNHAVPAPSTALRADAGGPRFVP